MSWVVSNVPCEPGPARVGFGRTRMIRTSAIRDAWHPQSAEDRQLVLDELHQILASPQFCNSKRYPALLQYIVESTLAGRAEQLKERTIGVEVFERPSSYDTGTDTVVRYTAGEVRKRLALYYHELDRRPAIQIQLPAGSYVPEFLHAHEDPAAIAEPHPIYAPADWLHGHELDAHQPTSPHPAPTPGHSEENSHATATRWRPLALLACVATLLLLGAVARYRSTHAATPLAQFWAPLLRDQRTVLVCSGGVVFKPTNFSGVETAGKDTEYPFVSSQIATSIGRISGLLGRDGAAMDLQFSNATPLTVLREQPVVLVGGYNNQWTMRLLNPMPYHFAQITAERAAAIVDTKDPSQHWMRDPALPYASADDYALVARFKDATTDSWVVVIAGLGRNGTEAAALFVTSPHYMELLRSAVGTNFVDRNIEAVLKVNVVDGRTGAPSILATQSW